MQKIILEKQIPGIVSVKVVLNKRKTYSFLAKFAGDNTFKAVSVKGK
ncbi:hypothetical protein [uncultured Methanobrevibacter sp.]|nr:hypothetical protein [uncultured Methanobrevibacter sp.]